MTRVLLIALAAVLFSGSAWAQAGVQTQTTVITTSTESGSGGCLPQNNLRKSLTIDNSANAIALGYCKGASCTAAIGTPPTTTIAANAIHYWPAGSAPSDALCFISASGSPSVSVVEGK